MKRIFLSLGFSGRSEKDVMDEIDLAKKLILFDCDEELEFVHNFDYVGVTRVECLGEAIKKMSTCDMVYFINNWEEHKGCIIEKQVCELYKIPYKTLTF